MRNKLKTMSIILSLFTLMILYTNCAPGFSSQTDIHDSASGLDVSDSSGSETETETDEKEVIGELTNYTTLTKMTDLRLLSNREMLNSFTHIFGDNLATINDFTSSILYDPFDNNMDDSASVALIEYINVVAANLSEDFVSNTALMTKYNNCTGTTGNDSCISTFINRMATMLYRRPLTSAETTSYLNLVKSIEPSLNVKNSIKIILETLIQDASFLYKWELGTEKVRTVGIYTFHSLDLYEYISRISFFLTGRGPSEDTLNKIAEGYFSTSEKIDEYIKETQQTDDYKDHMVLFFAAWLGFEGFKDKDADSLDAHKYAESAALIKDSIFTGSKDWRRVFNSKKTYITKKLADIYGVQIDGDQAWFEYENEDQMGFLAHLSFLGRWNVREETSTSRRGYHIYKRLFCGAPAPLPPGVDPAIEPGRELDTNCNIEKVKGSLLAAGSSCVECHNNFNKTAFGLENYGLDGRYRTHQNDDKNCQIDGQGSVPAVGKSFTGMSGLVDVGLETDAFEKCMAVHLVELGVGLDVVNTELSIVSFSQKILNDNDHNFETFVNELLLSDEFRYSARGLQ